MATTAHPVGAVLVGGASRRMGQDKALLTHEGEALAERACRSLAAHLEEVVVVSRALGDHPGLGVPEIEDRLPGFGPLSGVHAALEHAGGRAAFVLACDLPAVGAELVEYLLERAVPMPSEEPLVVLPELEGRAQPLAALYSGPCHREIESWLVSGKRRVLDFVDSVRAVRVELTPDLAFFSRGLLDNVNDPQEARRLGIVSARREWGGE